MAADTSKPVEFYIGRATDAFMDVEQRSNAVVVLCEKVNNEADAAQTAVNILAHRILTPNQDEALYVLSTVEALMLKCGSKVGKYKFLNQMVKLLSDKHHGTLTSPEVREKTVRLLFTWQKQMRHIEKFKEVYDNLRDHGVIAADPDINEEEIPVVPPPLPKLAPFEDEEKAILLKQLLASNNPDDLQAANRLIKSLVRSEDLKLEKVHKRQDDMDSARRACECMEHLLFKSSSSHHNNTDNNEIKAVYESLLNSRPVLYRYAGEAAENSEEILEEILALNDQVNRMIQRYQSVYEGAKNGEFGADEVDLIGGELSFEEAIAQLSYSSRDKPSSSIEPSAPFIDIDSNLIARPITPPKEQETLCDLSLFLENSTLFSNKTTKSSSNSSSVFDPIYPPLNNVIDPLHMPLNKVHLAPGPPVDLIKRPDVRLLLHNVKTPPGEKIHGALLTVINFGSVDYHGISLRASASSKNVTVQLSPSSGSSLQSFAVGPLPVLQQTLMISASAPVQEAEVDISLSLIGPDNKSECFTVMHRFLL